MYRLCVTGRSGAAKLACVYRFCREAVEEGKTMADKNTAKRDWEAEAREAEKQAAALARELRDQRRADRQEQRRNG
jgi:hypothetical protein